MPIRSNKKGAEDRVQQELAELSRRHAPLPADEVERMSHVAVSRAQHNEHSRPRSLRLAGLLAGLVALLAVSSPLLAAVYDRLQGIADNTGVREEPPSSPGPGYRPADEPYISVEPLMRYAGVSDPVVPRAAVTRRDGQQVVFTIATPHYTSTDEYEQLTIRATPVTTGEVYGNAVVVTSGLDPCAKVLVDPSEGLRDRDTIRSYSQRSNGEVKVDYQTLFDGRPAAPPPPIEGGIAYEEDGRIVLAIYSNDLTPPEGSSYEVETADGSVYGTTYTRPAEIRVPREALRPDRPLGTARLLSPKGETLATGLLDWYCMP